MIPQQKTLTTSTVYSTLINSSSSSNSQISSNILQSTITGVQTALNQTTSILNQQSQINQTVLSSSITNSNGSSISLKLQQLLSPSLG